MQRARTAPAAEELSEETPPPPPPTAAEKRRTELQAHLEKEEQRIAAHNARCRDALRSENAGGGQALGGAAPAGDPRAATRARAARLARAEKEKRSRKAAEIHKNAAFITRGGPGRVLADDRPQPPRTDAEGAAAARAAWLARLQ